MYLPFRPGGQGGEQLLVRTRAEAGQAMAARPFDLIPRRPGALEGGALGLLQGVGKALQQRDNE